MEYEWDFDKAVETFKKRGIDFYSVYGFDWEQVLEFEDTRRDYGEVRMVAFGPIDDRLYCLVYTMRDDICRVISLRKANSREVAVYEQAQTNQAH